MLRDESPTRRGKEVTETRRKDSERQAEKTRRWPGDKEELGQEEEDHQRNSSSGPSGALRGRKEGATQDNRDKKQRAKRYAVRRQRRPKKRCKSATRGTARFQGPQPTRSEEEVKPKKKKTGRQGRRTRRYAARRQRGAKKTRERGSPERGPVGGEGPQPTRRN